MDIERELEEMNALRASFDELIAHGEAQPDGRLLVSLEGLRTLKRRMDLLHDDLHEAAVAHANEENRRKAAQRK